MKSITALVIARNEAANIEQTVEGVRDLAAEVLVVDSGSTDGTQLIATQAGAKVLSHDWPGFGAQKNWGALQAKHNWILSIDADEVPNEELLQALALLKPDPSKIYGMNRITNFCGTWVTHGSWGRDIVWRFYHREHASWDERPVHENLQAKGTFTREILPGKLLHYSYPTLESHDSKLKTYTQLGAESLFAEGKKSNWQKRIVAPAWRAFRSYVLMQGWKDGWAGRELARRDFRMVREKYRILDKLWQNKGER